jgi:hypothetical protein
MHLIQGRKIRITSPSPLLLYETWRRKARNKCFVAVTPVTRVTPKIHQCPQTRSGNDETLLKFAEIILTRDVVSFFWIALFIEFEIFLRVSLRAQFTNGSKGLFI